MRFGFINSNVHTTSWKLGKLGVSWLVPLQESLDILRRQIDTQRNLLPLKSNPPHL